MVDQKSPICLWVGEEVAESQPRAEQEALFPLRNLSHISATTQLRGLPHPGKYLRLHPLLCNRQAKTKNLWPKWKKRSKLQTK